MPRTVFRPLRQRGLVTMITVCLLLAVACGATAVDPPTGLRAEGHDSRVDLVWDRAGDADRDLFNVYRAEEPGGPWLKLNRRPHTIHLYSDFTGDRSKTHYYQVTRLVDEETDFREYLMDTGIARQRRSQSSRIRPVRECQRNNICHGRPAVARLDAAGVLPLLLGLRTRR